MTNTLFNVPNKMKQGHEKVGLKDFVGTPCLVSFVDFLNFYLLPGSESEGYLLQSILMQNRF